MSNKYAEISKVKIRTLNKNGNEEEIIKSYIPNDEDIKIAESSIKEFAKELDRKIDLKGKSTPDFRRIKKKF